jgi:hypothetical protein
MKNSRLTIACSVMTFVLSVEIASAAEDNSASRRQPPVWLNMNCRRLETGNWSGFLFQDSIQYVVRVEGNSVSARTTYSPTAGDYKLLPGSGWFSGVYRPKETLNKAGVRDDLTAEA